MINKFRRAQSFFINQNIIDESDGCGAKFNAVIVSTKFQGKALLQRHR